MEINKLQTFTAAALVASVSASYAQEIDPVYVIGTADKANQVDAFKTGTPLVDIPQSLSVYTKEQLKEQGLLSVGDIVDYTVGLTNTQGEGHRDAVVFRGVRSTSAFFVDGVRDDVQYYRPLYNVEKVEVLRGPSALTFGRGGRGGVINRVMKKAEIGENFNEVEVSINSFGEVRTAYDTNISSSDKHAFRLNLHYDNLANDRDFYYGDQIGFNPTFTYKFSEDTTLRLSYEYNNHERYIDRGIPTDADGDPVSSLDGITFGDESQNLSTLEAHTFRATLDHIFSDVWSGSLTTSYSNFDKLYQNFYASGYDAATDTVEIDGYRDTTQRQRFQIGADIVGEFETGSIEHKLLLGVEYIHTSNDNDRYNTFWDSGGITPLGGTSVRSDQERFSASGFSLNNGIGINSLGAVVTNSFNTDLNDKTEADVNAFSFYLQDEISLNQYVDVILGARFDSFDLKVKDLEGGTSTSRTDEKVTPRVGIVIKPIETLSLYASFSETFLPASGDQYASLGTDDERTEPNTYENLEVGVKWNVNDALLLSAAAFKAEQTLYTYDSVLNTNTSDDAEVEGFELQLMGKLTDQWFISAGYTYLDGETASGDATPELPTHSFSIWNSYQITDKLGAGLGVIYQDESFSNGLDATLPSYVRVDLAAHYDFSDSLRVSLNIENLFDTNYYPDSHSTHQVSVGAPINARLGFTAQF